MEEPSIDRVDTCFAISESTRICHNLSYLIRLKASQTFINS